MEGDWRFLPVMKSCPFCGGEGEAINGYGVGYFPRCKNENCLMANPEVQDEQGGILVSFGTKEEAIAAWNKRVP
jgi:hypothetical protein